MAIYILLAFILTNIVDHFDFREKKYAWTGKWFDYPLYVVQFLVNEFVVLDKQFALLVSFGKVVKETLSSASGRMKEDSKYYYCWYIIINTWFFPAKFKFNHCERHFGE
jgi:hypothetical protein